MDILELNSRGIDDKKVIEVDKSSLKLEKLNSFGARKEFIQNIIYEIISKEKFTVNMNLDGVNIEVQYLERFIIELIPRLKEIGGGVVISNNNEKISNNFLSKYGL